METTILIARHGDVEGITPERFRGHTDIALTARGEMQARELAERVAARWSPSALYCSPLRRCRQTAAPVGRACGLDVEVSNALIDLDCGAWTWRLHADVAAESPERYALWKNRPQLARFPEGDAIQNVVARCADALRAALQRHPGSTALFVTHDSVIRCLLLQLLDMPLSAYWLIAQDPCALNEATIDGETVCVRRVNDVGATAASATAGTAGHSQQLV